MNKLALGTVQFGLNYGINNKTGAINQDQINSILDYSIKNEINIIDTAQAYGDSELKIGYYLKDKSNNKFNIISKLSTSNINNTEQSIEDSIVRLNVNKLYGFLYHDFSLFLNYPESFNILCEFRDKGRIDKVGFSVYYPHEIEYLLKKNIRFDLVQLPYSIFDRRFEYLFEKLKRNNVEIHTRSVYLQGLFFVKLDEIKPHFNKIKDKIRMIQEISSILNIPISALCLNFALLNNNIDKVVIGIDNIENLKENIDASNYLERLKINIKLLNDLQIEDELILLPFNWK